MAGYTFFQPDPRLGEVVEAIWDTDVPQPDAVGSLVLPLVSPILCFHFRVPPQLCFQCASSASQPGQTVSGLFQPATE